MRAVLRVRELTYSYPGQEVPALEGVSLDVAGGECVCVSGDSGCGKTTLLRAVKGLLRGVSEASVRLEPPERSVGLVFQNAENQILCPTVAEEVAFGPENLCLPVDEIGRAVDAALGRVGLRDLWDEPVERLSAGQQHRTCIAAILSMKPSLLLFDEPLAQLDAPSKAGLLAILRDLKRAGHAILVAEHDWETLAPLVDRHVVLGQGRVEGDRPSPRSPWHPAKGRGARFDAGPPAVAGAGLRLGHPESQPVFRGDLAIAPGERVHVFGENGCGKSTFLRSLAGVLSPLAGALEVTGVPNPRPEKLVGKVGYLLQNPERQLFEDTVEDEVAFTLRRQKRPADAVEAAVRSALELCEIPHLARRSPHCLSYGEAHRVALASVLAPRPRLVLLDEPLSGLDFDLRTRLLDLLGAISDAGTAVVVASHDAEPYGRWAHRVIALAGRDGASGALDA